MAEATQVLFVGIGSPHGDDQIGWRVADELAAVILECERQEQLDNWLVRKAKSPLDLLNWLDDESRASVCRLIICDACQSAALHGDVESGNIHCWTWPSAALPSVQFAGSHDMGLAAVLNLAGTLKRLPPIIDIWGIEIGGVKQAAELSSPLEHTASLVARRIRESAEMASQELNSI